MNIVRMRAEHVPAVQLQEAQAFAIPMITAEHAQQLANADGVAWTALDGDDVIACAGIVQVHEQRGIAWAMFSDRALRQFKLIHRVARAVLQRSQWRRIEMTVDVRHDAAIQWAERLGFEREGVMRAVTPDGRDCFLYAKVK
jgi:RimJ/RimL family protein N-acetyltransferase